VTCNLIVHVPLVMPSLCRLQLVDVHIYSAFQLFTPSCMSSATQGARNLVAIGTPVVLQFEASVCVLPLLHTSAGSWHAVG
jgi:hypothetical protein